MAKKQTPRRGRGVPAADAFDALPRRLPPNTPAFEGERRAAPPEKSEGESRRKGRPAPPQELPASGKDAPLQKRQGKDNRPQARRRKTARPANPAARRRRRRLAAVLGIVLCIGFGVWFSVTLLFKIQGYELTGTSPYTLQEVANAFGHPVGDNMYGFVVENAAERITTQLPYIEQVKIHRRLPATIEFEVTAARERYCLAWEDGFAVLSASQKVLRTAPQAVDGLVLIEGLAGIQVQPGYPLRLTEETVLAASAASASASLAQGADSSASAAGQAGTSSAPAGTGTVESTAQNTPQSGESAAQGGSGAAGSGEAPPAGEEPAEPPQAAATAAESFAALQLLLTELEAAGLQDVSWVDVTDPLALRFGWQNRVTVLLGGRGNLAEKLDTVWVLLCDEERRLVQDAERGTLDITYHLATGRVYFRQE